MDDAVAVAIAFRTTNGRLSALQSKLTLAARLIDTFERSSSTTIGDGEELVSVTRNSLQYLSEKAAATGVASLLRQRTGRAAWRPLANTGNQMHGYNILERTDEAQTYLCAASRDVRGPNALLVALPKRAELREDLTPRLGAAAAGQCRVSGKAVFIDIWSVSAQAPLARGGKP